MLAPVRFSRLKLIARSPAHYRYALDHPAPPTAAMRIGTAAHIHTLGASAHEIAIWDGGIRRGKVWDQFVADAGTREIISVDEWDAGREIAESIATDQLAADLLAGCDERERAITFTRAGRECAGRIDAHGTVTLVEIKTCADASPERFRWAALRLGYYAQLAWYADALATVGVTIDEAHIIAAEQQPPHVVQVYRLDADALDFGRRQYTLWWERLMQCEASGVWPGYAGYAVPLEPPAELGDVTLTIGGDDVDL